MSYGTGTGLGRRVHDSAGQWMHRGASEPSPLHHPLLQLFVGDLTLAFLEDTDQYLAYYSLAGKLIPKDMPS